MLLVMLPLNVRAQHGTFVKYSSNLQNVITSTLSNASLVSIKKMLGKYFKSGKLQSNTKEGFLANVSTRKNWKNLASTCIC